MITEFFSITVIGLLMIISPGPDFAIVTKTSVSHGRFAGISAAIGIGLANVIHVFLNLLGIGVLIAQSVVAFTVLKILGALYLLYIGYQGLRAKPKPAQEIIQKTETHTVATKGFYWGFTTSIINPKSCLFYLSLFSVILSSKTPIPLQLFYGVWLSSLAIIWFSLVALFFTHPAIGNKLRASKHWIERVTGGALVLLGLRLLSTKVA